MADINMFFGAAEHGYEPALFRGRPVLPQEPFATVGKQLGLKQLIFCHQTHGTDGLIIKYVRQEFPSFVIEGDYLITNLPNVGLGISTADCLPVVFVDPVRKVVGAIHAGWRGARSGILKKAIERAGDEFGCNIKDMEFHFGPSAQGCCYEVQPPFKDEFTAYPFAQQAFRHEGTKIYFDLPAFAALHLASLGAQKVYKSDACTICKPGYCSVRKSPGSALRQMTVVTITNF